MMAASASTILVTGAGGFAGRHLVAGLRRQLPEASVIATSRTGGPDLEPLDVTDAAAVAALVNERRPDACFHLAAVASVGQSYDDPRLVWATNLFGTLNIAEAMLKAGGRLIFASSAEVYGLSFRGGEPIDEAACLQPTNPYATSKAAADLALGEMAMRGLDVVRFRLFNHTGVGQSGHYVVPAFARQVARIEAGLQEPVIATGALDRWRDFLDVGDVVDAYLAALVAPALPPGVVINICSGVPRRIGDIVSRFLEISGIRACVVEHPPMSRPYDLRLSAGSPERARELLAFYPRTPWDDTLRGLLTHWRKRLANDPN